MSTADSLYLTAEQVSQLLQVSTKSVFRWAAGDPTMPAFRINRTLRFPRERLLTWLRAREQGPGRVRPRTREPLLSRAQVSELSRPGENGLSPCANSCAINGGEPGEKRGNGA